MGYFSGSDSSRSRNSIGLSLSSVDVFSIHSGAMMDRIGTRRVIILFGCAAIILNSAYPFFPSLAAVIAIQLFAGWAGSMGWWEAKPLIGQFMGEPGLCRQVKCLTSGGCDCWPSINWSDMGPFWSVFSFSFLACWACLPVISAMMLPLLPGVEGVPRQNCAN